VAKPIVKWAGGKTSLLGELKARLPTRVGTYAEPFAGGAALFFALADDATRSFDRAILADKNEDLVALYRAVKADVEAVLEALAGYRHDEDEFYRVRDQDGSRMSDVARGARLVYLNRTCFNGLWRVNKSGKFNVPFGRYENPRIVDPEGLRAASAALARAEIVAADFAEVTAGLGAGDFVYFDPPYVPVSKSASFTSYSAGGFGAADQERLVAELRRLRAAGVAAVLSNADTVATRELYADFAMQPVTAARAINSKASGRGRVGELIVTSWGPAGLPPAPVAVAATARGRKTASKGGARSPRVSSRR
jgi:DNA adenine methylase